MCMFKFDNLYERFKRFCTEWDEPEETLSTDSESETEVATDGGDDSGFPVSVDGYASSEPGTIKMMSYFTIEELCRSNKAQMLGISNTPSKEVMRNLQDLIDNVLDPLRRAYGRPIIINSGYRCYSLNVAVGGVKNSAHLKGFAADITGGNKAENRILWNLVRSLNLPIDQCIDEKDMLWVHVSYDKTRNRREFLRMTQKNGKKYYEKV